MNEFLSFLPFALFGGAIWFAIIFIAFIIICFIAESYDNGFLSFGAFVAFGIVFWFWGNYSFKEVYYEYLNWTMVGLYFGIGLVYSYIRTFFYGREETINVNEEIKSNLDRDPRYYDKGTFNRIPVVDLNIRGNVGRWWLQWPISLLTWVTGKLARQFARFVYDILHKTYMAVLNAGAATVPKQKIPIREEKQKNN